MDRVENLQGALSLTLADRLRGVGAGHGISASEQGALVTMLAHPDRPVAWLGEVLGLTSSGVTRLVDRLVEKGWATRSPGPDARQRRVRLTAPGVKQARALNRDRGEVLTQALSVLSATERADLERLLDKVVGTLTAEHLPALQTCRLCDRDACRPAGEPCPLDHTVPSDG
jgi:DNA-binding MarR family transcriptional regulator